MILSSRAYARSSAISISAVGESRRVSPVFVFAVQEFAVDTVILVKGFFDRLSPL